MKDLGNLDNKKRFKDILNFIDQKKFNEFSIEIKDYLINLKKKKEMSFCSDEMLEDIIYIIFTKYRKEISEYINKKEFYQSNKISPYVYFSMRLFGLEQDSDEKSYKTFSMKSLIVAQKLYEKIVLIENEKNNLEFLGFYKCIMDLLLKDNIYYKVDPIINYLTSIYDMFYNKLFACKIVDLINKYNIENINIQFFINDYMSKARMYYSDELVFVNNIDILLNACTEENWNANTCLKLFNQQFSIDKKQAGIYEDIDEDKLLSLEKNLNENLEKVYELAGRIRGIYNNLNGNYPMDKKKKILDNYTNSKKEELKKFKNYLLEETKEIIKDDSSNQQLENFKPNLNRKYTVEDVYKINPDFMVLLPDDDWFGYTAINILGPDYIAKSTKNQQLTIRVFHYRDLLKELAEILRYNPNFELYWSLFYDWINKETFKILGLNIIAHTTKIQQETINRSYRIGKIQLLSILLNHNNDFCLFNMDEDIILNYMKDSNLEILGAHYMANCNEQQQIMVASVNVKLFCRFLVKINVGFW